MSALETAPARLSLQGPLVEPFRLVCFALCIAQVAYLAASFVQGSWLMGPDGRGSPTDFVNVWAAGRLVLEGQPAAAYDWAIHKQVEDAAVGYAFPGYYGWHYPPPFLFVAALLALFPYVAAYAGWVVATLPLYLATVRWIVGHRVGWLLAGAFPAVLANCMVGQNGFVTATFLGSALGFMQRQPVLSGSLLGLLTYKPHFGLLIPLVLIVTGRWTVFWSAAIVGTAMAVVSWLAFGTATWEAFFHWLPITSKTFLSEGQANFAKLQSQYGLVRTLGGGEALAWALQGALAAATAVLVCLLWRSRVAFEMKAAALAVGTLLATPYLYLYDLVVLAVPVAFLIRGALRSGFEKGEMLALAAAAALIFVFPFVQTPVGLPAILIVAALVARRCRNLESPASTVSSRA